MKKNRFLKLFFGDKNSSLKEPGEKFHLKYPEYDIGHGTYGCPKVYDEGEGKTLNIGAYCSIAPNVTIFLGSEHRVDWVSTYPFSIFLEEAQHIKGHPRSKGDVIIGNDVWICEGATILSGVTIGNGAVVGNNAVVAKDVEPYSIVAGNPAKHLKYRFDEAVISRLEATKWWLWPEKELREQVSLILSSDINAFLEYAEKRN